MEELNRRIRIAYETESINAPGKQNEIKNVLEQIKHDIYYKVTVPLNTVAMEEINEKIRNVYETERMSAPEKQNEIKEVLQQFYDHQNVTVPLNTVAMEELNEKIRNVYETERMSAPKKQNKIKEVLQQFYDHQKLHKFNALRNWLSYSSHDIIPMNYGSTANGFGSFDNNSDTNLNVFVSLKRKPARGGNSGPYAALRPPSNRQKKSPAASLQSPEEKRRLSVLADTIREQYYCNKQVLPDLQKMEKVAACREKIAARHKKIRQTIAESLPVASMQILYGSAACGFGSTESDLDITLKVSAKFDKSSGANLKKVAEILNEADRNYMAEYIPGGIYPSVKAQLFQGFKIEISKYHRSAVEDAELLETYGQWDNRVFIVGFFVKKWAKAFGLTNDDGRNGFKSFHWILMTIYCLQRTPNNKVVPFIQSREFWDSNGRRHYKKEVTPNWSKNKSCVAELFLYFLDYYSNFSFKGQAIHIVDSEIRGRMEHESDYWSDVVPCDPICIPSPFYCNYDCENSADRNYYYYGGFREQNIASSVTQKDLKTTIDTMKMSADQIRGLLRGEPIRHPTLKKFFNMDKREIWQKWFSG